MARLKRVLVVGGAVYGLVLAMLAVLEPTLLYHPWGGYAPPAAVGLGDMAELVIKTPDKQRLVAWYAPAKPDKPVLLYFHGNGGNLALRADRIRRFRAEGWGVMMMTWRGFSGSTGSPSEAANIADARLAYDRLRALGVSPREIIVYGESLGTGVAVPLAVDRRIAGLVLEGPYLSTAAVAAGRIPLLPVSLVMRDQYRSDRAIGFVTVPILILHGEKDTVIPVQQGKGLFALAPEPKKFVLMPEGTHDNLPGLGGVAAVRDWLAARGLPRDADLGPPEAQTPPVRTSGIWNFEER